MKQAIVFLFALLAICAEGCGPTEGPEARCEDDGGSWVCDGNVGPAGEKCACVKEQNQ